MKLVQTRRPVLALVVMVLALIGLARPASAQMGMGMGMGDPSSFMSTISKRSLDDYARILSLTPEQKESLKTLHEGYVAQHAEAQKEIGKAMAAIQEKFQDTQDPKVFQKDMQKEMTRIQEKIEKLEKGFLEDAKALLTPQQAESWPRIERHRRRENGLRFQFMAGQGVDLVKVVDSLKLDDKAMATLADPINRYEMEMDRALQAMEKWGKDMQEKYKDFEPDFSKMQELMELGQKMMKEMGGYAKAMRDVNRQYARTIEPLLPEGVRAKFQDEFNRRAHPRIYREAWVTKAMTAALGFEDATDDQKKQIAELKSDYLRDAVSANKAWAVAQEAQEEITGGQMAEMMTMFGGAKDQKVEKAKEDTNKARGDRKDLDKRVKEKLLATLKEEQKARLPEEKKEGNGMFGFGGEDFVIPGQDDEDSK